MFHGEGGQKARQELEDLCHQEGVEWPRLAEEFQRLTGQDTPQRQLDRARRSLRRPAPRGWRRVVGHATVAGRRVRVALLQGELFSGAQVEGHQEDGVQNG